ncbi:hypothetical protein N7493_008113 [Penicillium malachiteum]|uniref:Mannose-6-phosphate isomerase n=1 Tax=Penicillium malachiteum TaxID=1324776 RepID=A0AAD6MTJ8_9EURO|nr:hypothetical protein N7493_008113 [Penicillium malachiteum]
MAGRAAMRTPEPPDRDEREASPPRLTRPKRITRPPRIYAQEQEIDNEQRQTRHQQKKRTGPESQPDRATSDDSATESDNLDVNDLVKEIAKLRTEIRLRDELHKEELQKAKSEFGAALAGVRHELQNLTDRTPTSQCNSEACAQTGHDEILREIQSLREEISAPAFTGSPSYADVARTPPLSHPNANHKPEMIIALTPFEALCGFRPLEEITYFLSEVRVFRRLVKAEAILERKSAKEKSLDSSATRLGLLAELLLRLSEHYPHDAGLFMVFCLNYVSLGVDEALFIRPNEVHAYLSGDGVECMATSANVSRGGFTHKLKHMMRHADGLLYDHFPPLTIRHPVEDTRLKPCLGVRSMLYKASADEFDVVRTDLRAGASAQFMPIKGPSILVCIEGRGVICTTWRGTDKQKVNFNEGSGFLLAAGSPLAIHAEANITIFRAFCDISG